jgi:protein TonB
MTMRDFRQDERLVYRRGELSPWWRLFFHLAALVLACLTALLMPFSDLFTRAPAKRLELRPVDTILWRPPAPPRPAPPPPPPPRPPTKPRPAAVRPRPAPPKPRPAPPRPLRLPVKLNFELLPRPRDLALNFEVAPEAEAPAAVAPPTPPVSAPEEPRVDKAPVVLSQVRPVYPYRARVRGIEGFVEVRFTVRTDGTVAAPEVVAAEPPGLFERSALRAVRRWRFAPAVRRGRPVETRVRIRIRFTLDQ